MFATIELQATAHKIKIVWYHPGFPSLSKIVARLDAVCIRKKLSDRNWLLCDLCNGKPILLSLIPARRFV